MLIAGASTRIGLIGAQMATALRASQVIGTTRSADKRDLLTRLGVDTVIVTAGQNLTKVALAATDGNGVVGRPFFLPAPHRPRGLLRIHPGPGHGRHHRQPPSRGHSAVARGEIRPVIDQTVDFADFRQAANRLGPTMQSARSS